MHFLIPVHVTHRFHRLFPNLISVLTTGTLTTRALTTNALTTPILNLILNPYPSYLAAPNTTPTET